MEYVYIETSEKQPRWFTMRTSKLESKSYTVSDIYTDNGLIRNIDGVNFYWTFVPADLPLTGMMESVDEFIPHMVLYVHNYELTVYESDDIECRKLGDTQYAMVSKNAKLLTDILRKRKEVSEPTIIVI